MRVYFSEGGLSPFVIFHEHSCKNLLIVARFQLLFGLCFCTSLIHQKLFWKEFFCIEASSELSGIFAIAARIGFKSTDQFQDILMNKETQY